MNITGKSWIVLTCASLACLVHAQKISDIGRLKLKDGEISASKACEIASKVAEGLGLGKLSIERYSANLQPVQGAYSQENKGPREWTVTYPNGKRCWIFRVCALNGELLGFEDPAISNLTADRSKSNVGFYAATRTKFIEHLKTIARRVGISEPLISTQTVQFDHSGRLKPGRPYTVEASYVRQGHRYVLTLERATGKLAKLIVYPGGKPDELELGQYKDKADFLKARDAATAFAKQLGLPAIDERDFLSFFNSNYRQEGPAWILEHPYGIFEVDALENSVRRFYSRLLTDLFEKGDKPVTTEQDEMKKLIENYARKLAISSEAVLHVSMYSFELGRRVPTPHIVGEYRLGNKVVARIVCDPYRGELESISLAPEGLPPGINF